MNQIRFTKVSIQTNLTTESWLGLVIWLETCLEHHKKGGI